MAAPMFHTSALNIVFLPTFLKGATSVLMRCVQPGPGVRHHRHPPGDLDVRGARDVRCHGRRRSLRPHPRSSHRLRDIIPGNGELLIRLDPLTAPRRTQALAALCDQLNHAQAHYPGTDLILRYDVKPHLGIA